MYPVDELKKEINIKKNTLKMHNKTRMEMLLRGATNDDCKEIEFEIETLRRDIDWLNNELKHTNDKYNFEDQQIKHIKNSAFNIKFPDSFNIDTKYVTSVFYAKTFKFVEIRIKDYIKCKSGKNDILISNIKNQEGKTFDFDIEFYDSKGEVAYTEHYTNCKITKIENSNCSCDDNSDREFIIVILYGYLHYKGPTSNNNEKGFFFEEKTESFNNKLQAEEDKNPFCRRIYW